MPDNVIMLFVAHLLGDFYFQSSLGAKAKETALFRLLLHCGIYSAVCVAAVLVCAPNLLNACLFISAAHFIIDLGKFVMLRAGTVKDRDRIFFIDQALHGASILAACVCFPDSVQWGGPLLLAGEVLNAAPRRILRCAALTLLVAKPANIGIERLLTAYRPSGEEGGNGGLIGCAERLIILIMLFYGQYSSAGLVLTAKSVARYERISGDRAFAEYYLLGTLASMLLVLSAFRLIY